MRKYLVAAVLVGLVWIAALAVPARFALPLGLAVVLTGVVVLGLGALLALKSLRARRITGRLASALASDDNDAGLRPDVRAQIEETRAEFERALRTLRSSKLGGSGAGALAALPWYVIIGPPGAGKSTLLRNSGLKFPYLNARRGAVRGVGGTRNCDWWMANEGILLDTAGRWSVEDDDQEEWLAFLDLLRRTRRDSPLNGILVSLSAAELLQPEGLPALAKKLRERIDEVMGRLEVTLPVYLIVTKCDLIGGFAETFAALDDRAREQIWGLTLPLGAEADDRPALFAERLDRLVDALEGQSLQRLGGEHRPEVSRRLYEFPQQFEELCPGLVDLVGDLFCDNAYRDTPILRGVYFTSGTQAAGPEGAQAAGEGLGLPIERVRTRLAEQLGIAPSLDAPAIGKSRSYFLGEVFRRVIFPDQNVAGQGERAVRRRSFAGLCTAAALFVGAAGLALLPLSAYRGNLALADTVERQALLLARSRGAQAGVPLPGEGGELVAITRQLLRQRTDGRQAGLGYGLHQGDKLDPLVGQVARAQVVVPLLLRDLPLLQEAAARAEGAARDPDAALAALHLHLLLTAPKAAGEPRSEGAFVQARTLATARWRAHVGPAQATPRAEQVIGDAVELYLRGAVATPGLWEPRHAQAVQKVRARLCGARNREPLAQLLDADDLQPLEFSLGGAIGGSITLFEGNPRLAGAFTGEGGRRVRLRLAERGFVGGSDAWLLGGCSALTAEQRTQLSRDYLRRFEEAWRGFIAAVAPVEKSELTEATQALRRYVDERPLGALWRALAENLRADPTLHSGNSGNSTTGAGAKVLARVEGAAGAVAGDDLTERRAMERRFEPLIAFGAGNVTAAAGAKDAVPSMLDTYHEQLRAVVVALEVWSTTRDPAPLRLAVSRARRDIEDLVQRSRALAWQPVLRKLLLAPLAGLEGAVVAAGAQLATRRWCDGVVAEFDRTLAGRYPFRGEGPDAGLGQVEKFFHPQNGLLWQYVQTALAADLEPQSFRPRPGTTITYRAELTSYLRRAQAATELLFYRGAQQITVPIEARIWPGGTQVAQTSLRIGEGRILHRNEAERFQALSWPAKDAVLSLKGPPDQDVVGLGDWGLFRLLDRAQVRGFRTREEFLRATFVEVMPGVSVAVDFKPYNLVSALRGLHPPRAIAAGGGTCGSGDGGLRGPT